VRDIIIKVKSKPPNPRSDNSPEYSGESSRRPCTGPTKKTYEMALSEPLGGATRVVVALDDVLVSEREVRLYRHWLSDVLNSLLEDTAE
jgi:hypothetical protein